MSAIAARSAAITSLDYSDTYLQVAALFALGNGWVSVWYCDGNPADKHSTFTAYSWRQAKDWDDITRDIEHCAAHYGDVYLSLTQHSEQRRQERTALPCQWIWLDDVTDLNLVSDAALVLETSPGKYQVLYRMTRVLSTAERRVLQRQGRVAVDGDPASSDPVKPIRVAGGYNTKAQGGQRNEYNHRVRLVWLNDNQTSPEELATRWPAIPGGLNGDAVPIAEAQVEVALGNIDAHRERARKTITPQSLAAKTLKNPDSAPSPSEARYRVIYGLISVGFLDHEIAALILHWTRLGSLSAGKQRSVASLLEDVGRCIGKVLPDVEQKLAAKGRTLTRRPTGGGYQRTSEPLRRPRVKAGLHHLSPEAYLAWVRQRTVDGALDLTVKEIASALAESEICVSLTTIERCERALSETGHIRRTRGRLVLLAPDAVEPVVISHTAPAQPVIILQKTGSPTLGIAHSDALYEEASESIETQPPLILTRVTPEQRGAHGEVVFLSGPDDGQWQALLASAAPPDCQADPGALAAWAVDGLCVLPLELLPPCEAGALFDEPAGGLPAQEAFSAYDHDSAATPAQSLPQNSLPVRRSAPAQKKANRQPQPVFGKPSSAPKRQPECLPHTLWATADVPSLEAELARRRAMLRYIKPRPVRSAIERTIFELERLIANRRDMGFIRMLYAHAPEPKPVDEPQMVCVGDAIAFANGAAFIPSGSVSEDVLRAAAEALPATGRVSSAKQLSTAAPFSNPQTQRSRSPAASTLANEPLPDGWAMEQCDHRGNPSAYGVYWRALGPHGKISELTSYPDVAQRDAWQMARMSDRITA